VGVAARGGWGVKNRSLGRWVLALLSAWFVVAALFWVNAAGRTMDVVEAIRIGGPLWMLAVPLLGIVGVAAAIRPRPGAYWLLAVLAVAQVILALNTLTVLDNMGLGLAWGAGLAILISLLYTVIALQLAFDDAPPLRSPISRVAYFGRRSHLLDLLRMAERWGWKASGPEVPNLAVRVAGEWAGRELHIESGAEYHLSLTHTSYYLSIAVRSERNLWPLALAMGLNGPKRSERKAAAKGKARTARGGNITFYLRPPEGTVAEEMDLAPLKAAMDSGSAFLKGRTTVNAAAESVWFGRQDTFQMPLTGEDVEAIIRWLDAIAAVMEKYYSDGAGASSMSNANPNA
jgi:hypothetical protein